MEQRREKNYGGAKGRGPTPGYSYAFPHSPPSFLPPGPMFHKTTHAVESCALPFLEKPKPLGFSILMIQPGDVHFFQEWTYDKFSLPNI